MDEYERRLDERENAAAYSKKKRPKICPVMSRNSVTIADGFVECQEDRCALWTSAYVFEGDSPSGQEHGCAVKVNAMKDSEGHIPA